MSTARLIICEKAPRWAPALRAALLFDALSLVETRSLVQCAPALAAAPASLVLVEISRANLEAAVTFIQRSLRNFPFACFLAALPADLGAAEMVIRNAGAAWVFTSTLEAEQAARMILRHFALHPPIDQELAEFVAAQMPWAPAVTKPA